MHEKLLGVSWLGKWKVDVEAGAKSHALSHLVCSIVEYIIPERESTRHKEHKEHPSQHTGKGNWIWICPLLSSHGDPGSLKQT